MKINNKISIEQLYKEGCRDFDPKTIILYLIANNLSRFFSWGVENMLFSKDHNGSFFRLLVHGYKHEGYVYIILNGKDLFDVYFTNKENIILDILNDLFCDQLAKEIDLKIEGPYEFYSKKTIEELNREIRKDN